ncbi:MAG TPA: ABC transporter ATP-binding protein [Limnochordia bacterium]|nr:ABC transporter ATP-binding protein [Limnochordia bacterium]
MEAIRTEGLTKRYGKARGIEQVSLAVPEGSFYGFIGPNGAGKSTTIRTLLGFLRPTAGRALLLGHEVAPGAAAIRTQIGYVPGEVSLYPDMRVGELLRFAARFYPGDHAARAAELAEALELDLSRKAGALSLGNRKKVSLIQALQHRPRLLLLDEPTSGLDPLIQQRFFTVLLEENARGMTIFFSSHVLSEVQRLCHTVAIIRDGRLLAVEDVAALRARQLKRVHVQAPADRVAGLRALGDLAGVSEFQADEAQGQAVGAGFLYSGEVDRLLAALGPLQLSDVIIEEPSLEEIFMRYYGSEAPARVGFDGT